MNDLGITDSIVEAIRRSDRPLGRSDLEEIVDSTEASIRQTLSQLAKIGRIKRVKRGQYVIDESFDEGKGPLRQNGEAIVKLAAPEKYLEAVFYDLQVSAGSGPARFDEAELWRHRIPRYIVEHILKVSYLPPVIGVCEVIGDCMTPTLNDGDLCFFHETRSIDRRGGMHILLYDDEPIVKRIQVFSDRSIRLYSDNAEVYAEELLVPNDEGTLVHDRTGRTVELNVVGPVIWPRASVGQLMMEEVRRALSKIASS